MCICTFRAECVVRWRNAKEHSRANGHATQNVVWTRWWRHYCAMCQIHLLWFRLGPQRGSRGPVDPKRPLRWKKRRHVYRTRVPQIHVYHRIATGDLRSCVNISHMQIRFRNCINNNIVSGDHWLIIGRNIVCFRFIIAWCRTNTSFSVKLV